MRFAVSNRRGRRRESGRIAILLILGLLPFLSSGCGNGFTGGGVPIGKGRMSGRVLSAESPRIPVPNAIIRVLALAPNVKQTLETTADDNGNFDITDIPTGLQTGNVQVTVTAPTVTYQSQQLEFLLPNGHRSNLLVSLPHTSFNTVQPTTLTIQPPSAFIRPGQSVRFTSLVKDANNATLPVTPTLLFNDDFGTIGADGTFTGSGSGTGSVTAFWYGGERAASNIIVHASSDNDPPPPPVVSK